VTLAFQHNRARFHLGFTQSFLEGFNSPSNKIKFAVHEAEIAKLGQLLGRREVGRVPGVPQVLLRVAEVSVDVVEKGLLEQFAVLLLKGLPFITEFLVLF
jgi:hypothetical protein